MLTRRGDPIDEPKFVQDVKFEEKNEKLSFDSNLKEQKRLRVNGLGFFSKCVQLNKQTNKKTKNQRF